MVGVELRAPLLFVSYSNLANVRHPTYNPSHICEVNQPAGVDWAGKFQLSSEGDRCRRVRQPDRVWTHPSTVALQLLKLLISAIVLTPMRFS
jgi:hypothetical protein